VLIASGCFYERRVSTIREKGDKVRGAERYDGGKRRNKKSEE
jgi:hypothetical protein